MQQGRYLLNAIVIMCIMAFIFNHYHTPILETGLTNAQAQDISSNIIPLSTDAIRSELTGTHPRPRLLVLYASWCPYCKRQMPALDKYVRDGADIDIIALSLDEDYQALSRYLGSWQTEPRFTRYVLARSDASNFPSLMSDLGVHFGGPIPHIALFDKQGKLRDESRGMVNPETIDQWLKQL